MSQFIEMFGDPLSLVQRYPLKKLGDCCELNPRRPNLSLKETDKVSFVPMPSVSENGYLQDVTDEEYGKVKKGFTYFESNDVVFAKITPCMENGKGAIAEGLTNNIGMGSTEFHVLRPIEGVSSPYWLLALTRLPIFRERASKNMTGTGGQKRVPANYLENFTVGLPPIEEQNRFENIYKQADKSEFVGFKSQFIEMFEGDKYPLIKLGDYTDLTWGDTNTTKNSYVTEGYLAYSASGPDGKLDHFDYDCEGIVLSAIGADCGKTWFASGKWSCIKNTIRFWSTFDDLDNRFLYFATREKNFWPRRGGAQPFIPQGDARNCSIPLPPICLQRKFVEIAEQADKSEFNRYGITNPKIVAETLARG